MSIGRALYHLARADFLERLRRPSFLLTLGFALYLGLETSAGRMGLRLGAYRGIYNAAWIGGLMTLVTTSFLTLVGFYVVKGGIEKDRTTGVGQILAATTLTRPVYTLGKAASSLLVLSSMLGVLTLAAVAMFLLKGEAGGLALADIVLPMLFVALPAMAWVAALAVLFECLPGLGGGVGNVAWFFVWTGLLLAGIGAPQGDLIGLRLFRDSMSAAARARFSDVGDSFVLGVSSQPLTGTFEWPGLDWTVPLVLTRLLWLLLAALVALLAGLFFDRFDSSRAPLGWRRRPAVGALPTAVEPAPAAVGATPERGRLQPADLAPAQRGGGRGALLLAELRLLLKGRSRGWLAVAAGLWLAAAMAPAAALGGLLMATWIWPVVVWSSLGCRERRFATGQIFFSAPSPLTRQLLASWAAGVLVTYGLGLAVGLRWALAGSWPAVTGWLAGGLFIPSLALAAGVWSGGAKLFEALYTGLWYVGPVNRVAPLDFMGVTAAPGTAPHWTVWLGLAALLLAAAFLGRRRELARD